MEYRKEVNLNEKLETIICYYRCTRYIKNPLLKNQTAYQEVGSLKENGLTS